MRNILREKIFIKVGVLIVGIFLNGVIENGIPPQANAELLRSTSHGLDLSKLHLVVEAPPEFDEQLYERARDHLTQAGLYPKTKSANTYKQWEPLFRLTFEVEPVDEFCLNLFLYTKKLEIVENVVPERTPKIRAWAPTWSVGTSWPEVRKGQVTLAELEKVLDELMRKFLLDFQYAN